MKKGFVLQSLICLLAVSCSIHEMETTAPVPAEDDVFYASLEPDSQSGTKVHVELIDNMPKLLWDAKDQISIFNKTTLNQKYEFMGNTGDNAGYFKRVTEETETRTAVDGYVCAVYPYLESTSLDDTGVLTLTLPEEQTYREGSFGPGANTMVSTTNGDFNLLKFKNVGGYLVLKFYGQVEDQETGKTKAITIKSIKLEGRNGELLSGEATMTPVVGMVSEIEMAATAGTSITLNADKVKLGKTENEATEFWMVVPPTDFTRGMILTVKDKDEKEFIYESDIAHSITRNGILRGQPIEVVLLPDDPDQVIYYTTSDKRIITPSENAVFAEESLTIASNKYVGMRGIMAFSGEVTKIGDHAFEGCETLTGMTIPATVTSIGDYAFAGCTNLTEVIIPSTVSSIGKHAFDDCENLASITIPAGITKIEDFAFAACHSFTSIVIPKGVKVIGEAAFNSCINLTNIEIELPSSLGSIGVGAFEGCSELTDIVIPEQVKVIAPNAFEGCKALTSIILPESIALIDDAAFRYCSNLNFITVQATTLPTVMANTFEDTNNCPIYVPAEKFSDYKNDTEKGWSNYASRIHSIGSPDGKIQGHDYVDMGKGLKWATTNVGSDSPDGTGSLFAWGRTEPISLPVIDTPISVESFVDTATELWGDRWRTPTIEEWDVLKGDHYLWTWDDERKGYEVESLIPGYEGNSIFLPAAGATGEQALSGVGTEGFYWSSTPFTSESDDSSCLWFSHGSVFTGGYFRGAGLSVRPVSD